jgi:hypothetical protein
MTDNPEGSCYYDEYKEEYEELRRRPELIRLFLYMSGLSD